MWKSVKQIDQEKDEEIKTLKKSLERSFSEEDMKKAFESNYDSQNYGNSNLEDDFKEWFEQFKKK